MIATQNKDKEFIYAGLGQLPSTPVNIEFDKLNYKTGETAIISLTGKASEVVNLLIIDPSDKPKGETKTITLLPDGTNTYELELKGYGSGVYTAVVSKGSAQSSEVFTVGLLTGSGDIDINTTKIDYLPGDPILILGNTNSNVLLTITLTDPDGKEVKVKESFSDKEGKISESSFRIPSDGKPGMWTINAKSGSNFDNAEIKVLATLIEGMIVTVEKGNDVPGVGKTLQLIVRGAENNVQITITSDEGEQIFKSSFPPSKSGEINQPWIIPKDTEPGTYTITANDSKNSAESTFVIE